jgi:hypothetical protein
MRKKILLALALLCAAPPARADILIPGATNITVASLLTPYIFHSPDSGNYLQPGNNGGLLLTMDGTKYSFALINLINTNNTGGFSAGHGDFIDMFVVVSNAQQEVTSIGSNGSYQTAAYINVNGHYGQNTPPYIYWIAPSSDPSMILCYGDITGPCIQARNSGNVAGTRNFDALDWQGNYSLSIDGNNHQLLMGRSSTYAAMDTFLGWPAAATFQFGGADAAAPVAQTIKVQNVLAGTSNTVGVDTYFKASAGTGTGLGGLLHFQTALAGSSSTFTVTFTNSSSTIAGTGLPTTAGTPVAFTTTGALPTNFSTGVTYYILSGGSSSAATVAATPGGTAIVAGSGGSGTQTLTQAAAQNTLADEMTIDGASGVTIYRGGNNIAQLTFAPNSGPTSSFGSANGGSGLVWLIGTTQEVGFTGSGLELASTNGYGFANGSGVFGPSWSALWQCAAATSSIPMVCVGSGGTRQDFSGTLKLTSEILAPLAYATLPASPTAGQRVFITNSNTNTFGATVTGTGSFGVAVLYNGSNWVVD